MGNKENSHCIVIGWFGSKKWWKMKQQAAYDEIVDCNNKCFWIDYTCNPSLYVIHEYSQQCATIESVWRSWSTVQHC
jgi:hypothetical protein